MSGDHPTVEARLSNKIPEQVLSMMEPVELELSPKEVELWNSYLQGGKFMPLLADQGLVQPDEDDFVNSEDVRTALECRGRMTHKVSYRYTRERLYPSFHPSPQGQAVISLVGESTLGYGKTEVRRGQPYDLYHKFPNPVAGVREMRGLWTGVFDELEQSNGKWYREVDIKLYNRSKWTKGWAVLPVADGQPTGVLVVLVREGKTLAVMGSEGTENWTLKGGEWRYTNSAKLARTNRTMSKERSSACPRLKTITSNMLSFDIETATDDKGGLHAVAIGWAGSSSLLWKQDTEGRVLFEPHVATGVSSWADQDTVESVPINQWVAPGSAFFCTNGNEPADSYPLMRAFFCSLLVKENHGKTIYAHNAAGFDLHYILNHLPTARNVCTVRAIMRGNKVIRLDLSYEVLGKKQPCTIAFCDSYLIVGGTLAASAVGWNSPVKKLSTAGDVFAEFSQNKNWKATSEWMHNQRNITQYLMPYMVNDILACQGIMQEAARLAHTSGVDIRRTPTAPSIALASARLLVPDELQKMMCHDPEVDVLLRKYYIGGRTEVFRRVVINGLGSDVVSMYPWVMREFELPCGALSIHNAEEGETLSCWDLNSNRQFVDATVHIPVSCRVGPLPVRTQTAGLVYPTGEVTGSWYMPELKFAVDHYGVTVRAVHSVVECSNTANLRDYVDHWFLKKEQAEAADNVPLRTFAKMMLNSLYGRLGMSVFGRRSLHLSTRPITPDDSAGIERLRMGKQRHGHLTSVWMQLQNPQRFQTALTVSAAITSRARIRLLEAIELVGPENVVYCDTDSLYVKEEGAAALVDSPLSGTELGQFKMEWTKLSGVFVARKTYFAAGMSIKHKKDQCKLGWAHCTGHKGFSKPTVLGNIWNEFQKTVKEEPELYSEELEDVKDMLHESGSNYEVQPLPLLADMSSSMPMFLERYPIEVVMAVLGRLSWPALRMVGQRLSVSKTWIAKPDREEQEKERYDVELPDMSARAEGSAVPVHTATPYTRKLSSVDRSKVMTINGVMVPPQFSGTPLATPTPSPEVLMAGTFNCPLYNNVKENLELVTSHLSTSALYWSSVRALPDCSVDKVAQLLLDEVKLHVNDVDRVIMSQDLEDELANWIRKEQTPAELAPIVTSLCRSVRGVNRSARGILGAVLPKLVTNKVVGTTNEHAWPDMGLAVTSPIAVVYNRTPIEPWNITTVSPPPPLPINDTPESRILENWDWNKLGKNQ